MSGKDAADNGVSNMSLESLVAELADEFSARLERGENPDISEFCMRFPQHAAVLRQVFSSLQLIRLSGAQSVAGALTAGVDATAPLNGLLGDFRIVREVGRGGMGVVYEAEQLSLHRRVALKVLPFAAALDPKQLQRFHNEAHLAAQLHHQNIAPVYGIGCERGVHYYAMQYIEGSSLAGVVAELRRITSHAVSAGITGGTGPDRSGLKGTPDKDTSPVAALSTEGSIRSRSFCCSVARIGLQAAQALHHAHELGVVHRDIKPANLMLDAAGTVWVTDFGLAQLQGCSDLTMTGDILGTIRYMSPEQALADRSAVDQRTDIYSLGITLWEILTLQPAFPGSDRQELLRKIAFEEPKPVRGINPSVPGDLETIVLKAIMKAPSDRYATAAELAADLDRFLKNEPITARRPTVLQRVAKWSRRHQIAVLSATLFLAIAVGILAVSNVRIRMERNAKDAALVERSEALRAREAALVDARAEQRLATTEAAKATAISNLLQEMLRSANPEQVKGADYTVSQLLADFSSGLGDQLAGQPEVEATIHATVGKAYWRLGVPEKAEQHLKLALELRRRVYGNEDPRVAESMIDYAWHCTERKRYVEAEALGREALQICQNCQDQRRVISVSRALLQFLIRQQKFELAERLAHQTLENAAGLKDTENPDVACILHDLAGLKNALGQYSEAVRFARDAVALHLRVHGEDHIETAWGLAILGQSLNGQHKYAEAEDSLRQALEIFRRRVGSQHRYVAWVVNELHALLRSKADHPGLQELASELLDERARELGAESNDPAAWIRLGEEYAAANYWETALQAYDRALEKGAAKTPALHRAQANLYLQQGSDERKRGHYPQAESLCRQALSRFESLAGEAPGVVEYQREQGHALWQLGVVLWSAGRYQDAEPWLRRATQIYEATMESSADPGLLRTRLTWSRSFLAERGIARQDHQDAARLAEQMVALPFNSRDAIAAAVILSRCAGVAAADTSMPENQRTTLARTYSGRARELIEQSLRRCPDKPVAQNGLAWLLATNASLVGLYDTRVSVQLAEKALATRPEEGSFWKTLGAARYRAGDFRGATQAIERSMELSHGGGASDWFLLAMSHAKSGRYVDARAWFDRATVWTKEHSTSNEELLRLSAEAAAALDTGAESGPAEVSSQR